MIDRLGGRFRSGVYALTDELWYHVDMTPKLNKDLADAFSAAASGELKVVNPNNNRICFVVDGEMHQRAMAALRQQQDRDAIEKGLRQMESGEGIPLDESMKGIRRRLGFPQGRK